jgi:hypothetical protein
MNTNNQTEPTPRLLTDLMKENPKDFDFSNIPDAVPGKSSDGTSATLTQILGGFIYVGTDEVTGIKFYGRKPKLNGLQRILDMMNTPIEGIEAMSPTEVLRALMGQIKAVSALLLYVQDVRHGWRPASEQEIGDAFDVNELKEINGRFAGLTSSGETPEGNATSQQTTG